MQIFERRGALEEKSPARILGADAVRALAVDAVIGFGASPLLAADDRRGPRVIEPPPLAAVAARLASTWRSWGAGLLTEPLYLRPAPTTPSPRG